MFNIWILRVGVNYLYVDMADDDEFALAEYVSDEELVNDEIEIQAVKKKAKTFFIFRH